ETRLDRIPARAPPGVFAFLRAGEAAARGAHLLPHHRPAPFARRAGGSEVADAHRQRRRRGRRALVQRTRGAGEGEAPAGPLANVRSSRHPRDVGQWRRHTGSLRAARHPDRHRPFRRAELAHQRPARGLSPRPI
ncbi:MAG: hypothetical protein AVDCRST_MAG68-4883, partial [uncultured Gemmatimonadetes bacterium]